MVQEFQVVRCFSCHTFQVQQVKKVNRWSCKLCGDKQSLLKEYGRGSGADCRRHVQKLNAMRGAKMEEQEQHTLSLWQQVEEDGDKTPEEERDDQVTHSQVSCWTKYLDTPEEAEPEEDEPQNAFMDGQQLHGNNMMDRKKTRRDRWTDRRQESRTPEQRPVRPSDWTSAPSLSRTSAPSLSRTSAPSLYLTSAPSLYLTSAPSLNLTSAPSLSRTSAPSLNHTSAPSLNHTSGPSLSAPRKRPRSPPMSSGAGSRWARYLSSGCQVKEGEELSGSGRSLSVAGPSSLSRPRPLLPVSSMFQSGDDFNFDDDDFLTADST